MLARIDNRLLIIVAFLPFFIAAMYFRVPYLELEAAANGLSPIQIAVLTVHPQWFGSDFPSGALEALKSLPFMVYPTAYRLGLNITYVWAGMIALEMVVVFICARSAFRIFFPSIATSAATFAGLAYVASSIMAPDIARFKIPYYGWNYGFAIVSALLVVAFTVRRRYFSAALSVVITLAIHPIFAMQATLFAVACFCIQVVGDRKLDWLRIGTAAILAIAGGGSWLWWLSTQGTIGGGDVDPQLFVAFTRAQSYHWYPQYLGVFWELHANHLVPLISSLALIAWSISTPRYRDDVVVPQLLAGITLLTAICICGVGVTLFSQSPFLLKLALHRADTMALNLGMLLVIRAVWLDLLAGDLLERILSVILILVPFQSDVGMVPYVVAVRVAFAAIKSWHRGEGGAALIAAIVLAGSALALVAFYRWNGIVPDLMDQRYLGVDTLIFAATALVFLVALTTRRLEQREIAVQMAVVIVAAGLAVMRTPRFNPFPDSGTRAMAESARQAQLWARDNTPIGTLFMPDPGMDYFWRDLSERPSFGTHREWLLISIMYNSRQDLLAEGLRRYQALGLPFPEYILNPSPPRMLPLLHRLGEDASAKFYAMSSEDFARFAQEFGVKYFVFRTSGLKGDPPIRVVFRNAHFVIGEAPDRDAQSGSGRPTQLGSISRPKVSDADRR